MATLCRFQSKSRQWFRAIVFALTTFPLFASTTVQSAVVSAGNVYTVAIKSDSSLWGWGYNGLGQLGDGTTTSRLSPILIGTGYSAIAAGIDHSVALKSDGSLWAWGVNNVGQLGDGTTTNRLSPVLTGDHFSAVAVGDYHSVALKDDGSLWAWGGNFSGQLGDGTTTTRLFPTLIGTGYSAVAAGVEHTIALKSDGSLWAWGANSFGQLGNGTTSAQPSPILIGTGYRSITAGKSHSLAVMADGSLWAWGANSSGQLGDGTTKDRSVPVLVGNGYSAVISAGYNHTVAVKTDGSLWAWGGNGSGQLGDGTTVDRLSPVLIGNDYSAVAVGNYHTVAVKTNGSLWAWGQSYYGQLGNGTTLGRSSPAQILASGFATSPSSTVPQSGWWWNPAEPGRGYFIEVRNGRFYTAAYVYDNSGNAIWYVTGPGSLSGNTLPGTLNAYSGGQTLTGTYRLPTGPFSAGSMSISFSDTTHGTIAWPGGNVPITRYELATGSLNLPAPTFKPETGWWWNANEGGRGFSIEVQGDNLFIGGFMYDGGGNPVWYVSAGKMTTPTVYQGTWMQYWNGQAMGGVFKPASVKNPNAGGITISFTSTTTATMYLPDGRAIPLMRYSF